jgi:hypothetical protein
MNRAKAVDEALRRLAAEHQRFLPIAPQNGMVQEAANNAAVRSELETALFRCGRPTK